MNKRRDFLITLAVYVFLAAVIYLFYRSVWAFVLMPVCIIFYNRMHKKALAEKKADELAAEFRSTLESMTAAMRAGYSVENALRESLSEMRMLYGSSAPVCKELTMIINEIHLGVPAETAFDNFAQRCQVEDIHTFANVFRIAKRTGGDMISVMLNTAEAIGAKVDTQNEISVLISSKRLEQNLLFLMPPAIILYIDLTSPDLLEPLYGNITGTVIMTACLAVYAGAFFLARRIMDLKV